MFRFLPSWHQDNTGSKLRSTARQPRLPVPIRPSSLSPAQHLRSVASASAHRPYRRVKPKRYPGVARTKIGIYFSSTRRTATRLSVLLRSSHRTASQQGAMARMVVLVKPIPLLPSPTLGMFRFLPSWHQDNTESRSRFTTHQPKRQAPIHPFLLSQVPLRLRSAMSTSAPPFWEKVKA